MLKLKGEHIYLRAIEPDDLKFLYELENDTAIWEVSGTATPYSKHVLQLYLDNAHRDIYDVKQLRLCICNLERKVVGLIDLFDFDPKNNRAGLGIVIKDSNSRNQGIGNESIRILVDYGFSILNLHQIFANVAEDNEASIHLFEKLGFHKVGVKKDWILVNGGYKNEILFQKIKE
ncbi:GNAT family N-acetyltransferase [Maribacter algarum]|uniref:GNAT family N-acetyltransferase n=1 Tax=Maribacter algarum (ex Zhang et al. 2020) TaxID=2578118 RepID=A0A5S3PHA5_9FLAO|nr:GNAT family protein [Maribacter algarum]TMM53628.1 GNAT family N-acetyltransferase [Maribacter algarum]